MATSPSPYQELALMMRGFQRTQLLYVAAKLGIADMLQDAPKRSDELVSALRIQPQLLHRFMRGLAGIGILVEATDGQFSLTSLGECLISTRPGSAHGRALLYGDLFYRLWADLLNCIQTGESATQHLFHQDFFAYLEHQPDMGAYFNEFMTSTARQSVAAAVAAYDFGSASTVIDVGGGQGMLLAAILQAYPHLRGILFDRAAVLAGAPQVLAAAGVTERCNLVAGDFFRSVPTGGDIYLLSYVIHDWDDEHALSILQNCRRAMGEQGRVVLFEHVLPDQVDQPSNAVLIDIDMLVLLGGQERSETEYRALFSRAGFELSQIIATGFPRSLIEGVPKRIE